MKFYRCKHCGQIAVKEVDKNLNLVCCGSEMEELTANTSDGAGEKHVPVVRLDGNRVHVFVGDVEHPMLDVHYIMFIAIETNLGKHVRYLKPGEKPQAEFILADGEHLIRTYEYCNLHSLWSKE